MIKFILLTTALCIVHFSFSQTDFRKGYVITNTRDTLFGVIDYRESSKAFKSCTFKKSIVENTIIYEPNSIIGYGFENDKTFESKEITIKDQLPKVVFLEVIVRGLVSLYKFEELYFLEKNTDGLYPLINKTQETMIDGNRVLKNTNQYIGTINMLLFDCPEIRPKVQTIRLVENILTNLIEEYNSCMGVSSFTFKAKKPWTKAMIGLTGGVNISQLNFANNPRYKHLGGEFDVSQSPMIGISLDVISPRISERISFHNDILYLKSRYYKYSQFNNSFTSAIETNYVTFELQQLKIPVGIRYTFPKRNFTPYFTIGLTSTLHLNSTSEWIKEVESNNTVTTVTAEALAIKNNQFGLWGGIGAFKTINKVDAFFEIRYEQTNGISQTSTVSEETIQSSVANFQIVIGLRTK